MREYKYWLSSDECQVHIDYDGHDDNATEAENFIHRVILRINDRGFCTLLDLVNFDCDIRRFDIKPVSYSEIHGWSKNQVSDFSIIVCGDGYWVHLGRPVKLFDERKDDHSDDTRFYKSDDYIPNALTPRQIWFNEHGDKFYTTVEWMDGVKTTVVETEKANASQYAGFTAALAKRLYGTGTSIRFMNTAIDKAGEKKKQREEERAERKLKKKLFAEFRKNAREEKIKEAMERFEIEREAKYRLFKMEVQRKNKEDGLE